MHHNFITSQQRYPSHTPAFSSGQAHPGASRALTDPSENGRGNRELDVRQWSLVRWGRQRGRFQLPVIHLETRPVGIQVDAQYSNALH